MWLPSLQTDSRTQYAKPTLPLVPYLCHSRCQPVQEVSSLASAGRFDHIVIESTGIGEPLPVAAAFAAVAPNGRMLADVAKLDTMVTGRG